MYYLPLLNENSPKIKKIVPYDFSKQKFPVIAEDNPCRIRYVDKMLSQYINKAKLIEKMNDNMHKEENRSKSVTPEISNKKKAR